MAAKTNNIAFPGKQRTLNIRGKLLTLDTPLVMGILNITPDSFYSDSRVEGRKAVERAGRMIDEGATIIDIGGASSRPGSEVISPEEELQRLKPTLEIIVRELPDAIISIDTWRAEVARWALDTGAHIINDISGGTVEPEIIEVTSRAEAPYVLMHMFGTPGHLEIDKTRDDVVADVLSFFAQRIRDLRVAGITDIILDPGFGFGKSVSQNFEMLRKLEVFRFLGLPLLVGISRKSMIWRTLGIAPDDASNGTTALHMVALEQGADILRVHDVKEAMQAIRLFEAIKSS